MTNGISRRAAIRAAGVALAGSRALPASVYGPKKVTALVIGGDRYHNMDYIRTALAKTLGRDLGLTHGFQRRGDPAGHALSKGLQDADHAARWHDVSLRL